MFPCSPSMVEEVRTATRGSSEALTFACKRVRNACIGAPKRKQRFVEYGLVPALASVVMERPTESNEALVTLSSLAMDPTTLDAVANHDSLALALWELAKNTSRLDVAEAAARVLKTVLERRPEYWKQWSCTQEDVYSLLLSHSPVVSALGASLVSSICLYTPAFGLALATSQSICECLKSNYTRSEDYALALACVSWVNPVPILSCTDWEPFARPSTLNQKSLLWVLYDFWCMSFYMGKNRPSGVPPPSSCVNERLSNDAILDWALNASVKGNIVESDMEYEVDSKRMQREAVATRRLGDLLLFGDVGVKNETAMALAVFCSLDVSRQELVTPLIEALVIHIQSGTIFPLIALLFATGRTRAGMKNAQVVLANLLKHSESAKALLEALDESSSFYTGAMRLVRHLTFSEESLAQVIKLGIHTPLIRAIPSNSDAMAALANVCALIDNPAIWSNCADIVRRIWKSALDQNNDYAWALLVNLSAATNIEYKRAFVSSGISLARLVSERGMAVLRNLSAGGSEHLALIDTVVGPGLMFVASALSEESPHAPASLVFLCNVAACGDSYKSAIVSDGRLLQLLVRSLDPPASPLTQLAALRVVANLTWPHDAAEDDHTTSPTGRSTMVRLMQQARVMAAASRTSLRFSGGSSPNASASSAPSAASLAAARQHKLASFGVLERVRRLATEGPEGFAKRVAQEVIAHLVV